MNARETVINRMRNLGKYRARGGPTYQKPKTNQPSMNVNNTLLHELWKLKVAYEIRKKGHDYIMEAAEVARPIIRDVVDLDEGEAIEIVAENDTPDVIAAYKADKVTIKYATWEGLREKPA